MDDSFYKLVKTVFHKTKRAKPTNAQEPIEFYGGLIKSATCRKLVSVSGGQVKLNTDFVQEHLYLNSFKNTKQTGFSEEVAEHVGIEV